MTVLWRPSPRSAAHTARVGDVFDLTVEPQTARHFGRDVDEGYAWRVESTYDREPFAGLSACSGTADTLPDAKRAAVEALRTVLGDVLRELPLIEGSAPVKCKPAARRRRVPTGDSGTTYAIASERVTGDGVWD